VWYDDGSVADSNTSLLSTLSLSLRKVQALMVYQKDEFAPGLAYRRVYQGYDAYVVDGIQLLGSVAANYDSMADAAMSSGAL